LAVAVSSSGDWILCGGIIFWDSTNAYLYLWGPANQLFSVRFERGNNRSLNCVTINTSQDRLHRAVLVGSEDYGYEVYEWTLSLSGSSDPEITITPTAASEDVVSELEKAQQGSRELLPQGHNTSKLHIRYVALDGVVRCSCKAAAVFDSEIYCESNWSETTAQPGDRASTSPKVAVGLEDGTVHFMELCWNNISPL
jgi:hypothetical protein